MINLTDDIYILQQRVKNLIKEIETLSFPCEKLKNSMITRLQKPTECIFADSGILDKEVEGIDRGISKLEPIGVYIYSNQVNSQIHISPARIKQASEILSEKENNILKKVFIHEFGHHVFRISEMLPQRLRTYISEGAANFFVYLLSNNKERALLSNMADYQTDEYKFYRVFVEWENVDPDNCYSAFYYLALGNEKAFYSLFFKYLLLYAKYEQQLISELIHAMAEEELDYKFLEVNADEILEIIWEKRNSQVTFYSFFQELLKEKIKHFSGFLSGGELYEFANKKERDFLIEVSNALLLVLFNECEQIDNGHIQEKYNGIFPKLSCIADNDNKELIFKQAIDLLLEMKIEKSQIK